MFSTDPVWKCQKVSHILVYPHDIPLHPLEGFKDCIALFRLLRINMFKNSCARSSYPDPRLHTVQAYTSCAQANHTHCDTGEFKTDSSQGALLRYGVACKAYCPSYNQYCTVRTLFLRSIDGDAQCIIFWIHYLPSQLQVFNKLPAAETPPCRFLLWHCEQITRELLILFHKR